MAARQNGQSLIQEAPQADPHQHGGRQEHEGGQDEGYHDACTPNSSASSTTLDSCI